MERICVEVSAQVHFVEMFGCDGPEAAALVDLCWSNAVFDCARQMLAELFPRCRFETKFGVTVGSLRAGKGGTYFMGKRDLELGLERRDRMLAKGQLAIYSVQHGDEPFSVTVGIDFARACFRRGCAAAFT